MSALMARAFQRRGARRGGRGGGGFRPRATLPSDVLAIVDTTVDGQRGSAFRADSYALASGKVSDLIDLVDRTHTMHQDDEPLQADAPAVSSALGGRLALTLTAAQLYASTRAASAWRFMSNGLGGTQYHVFLASPSGATSRVLAATYKFGSHATQIGSVILHTATSVVHNVGRADATRAIIRSIATTVTADVAYIYRVDYFETGAQDDHWWINGALAGQGTSSAAGSASDPTSTMCLFANPDGTNGLAGSWAESLFIPKAVSAGEDDTILGYLSERYGVAV
jgi:hypothetical protein